MTACTFVHAADLHLDAPFRGLTASLARPSPAQAQEHTLARMAQNSTFTALERLTATCLAVQADFLILAGDVYNSRESSLRARLALRDAFLTLEKAGVRVFLAHGNHDPLTGEDNAIPWPANVTVFGGSLSSHTVTRNGEAIALVHGISHVRDKEHRNLAALFSRRAPTLLEADILQIGVLHCALLGNSGAHAAYAPCTITDLTASGLDYWALGHVHTPQTAPLHSGSRPPYYAYPGSLQGLHVNETGDHGCLVIKATGTSTEAPRMVPLAPLVWHNLSFNLEADSPAGEEIATVPDLENALLERLEELAAEPREEQPSEPGLSEGAPSPAGQPVDPPLPEFPAEAHVVRLVLTGRSPLDHELRKAGALATLRERLDGALRGSPLWLRDIQAATRPVLSLEGIATRPDLMGEAYRTGRALREHPEDLAAAAEVCFHPLHKNAKLRPYIQPPADADLAEILGEAEALCLDLLGGE